MKCNRLGAAAAVALALVWSAQASAQEQVTTLEEVVVIARQSGVPIWRVGDEQSSVILVGVIAFVPADVRADMDSLEEAVTRSRAVLHSARITNGNPLLAFQVGLGRYEKLPSGQSLAQWAGPEMAQRLASLAGQGALDANYDRFRPWWAAERLRDRLVEASGPGYSAVSVAKAVAERDSIPYLPVVEISLRDALEQKLHIKPGDRACLEASLEAAEAGEDGLRSRAVAWSRNRFSEVADNALSRAERLCWPDSHLSHNVSLRNAWHDAVSLELTVPGVVVALVPILYLIEPGGILDDLDAQGRDVDGPTWRDSP